MITREPKVGDKIQYNPHVPYGTWRDAGAVVAVIGNLVYTCDSNSCLTHEQYFGCSPVPEGCETANSGFIWRFRDGFNKMHRIVE